ncbi:MAG: hypothetical protein NT126_03400 [Bacteroidetes bacterium]|nr:hypothetical protein [Bacteroidota bacterium]
MRTLKQNLTALCFIILCIAVGIPKAKAQDETKMPGLKFLLSGDAYMGLKYQKNSITGAQQFTFTNMGVNPVFLWKLNEKMIFEGEVEFQNRNPHPTGYAVGEGLEVELEYCNFGYIINDYMILRAGTFFSTMGIFEDWHHQRITNKMVSRPLGIGAQSGLGIESGTDLGFNLRGAIPCGSAKMNYSIDITSGPRLLFEENAEEGSHAGQLQWEGITDNNMNKAIGGRIGFLPLSNSSLEIGVSGQTSKVGDDDGTGKSTAFNKYNNIGATYFGADLCYNKDIEAIKGSIVFRSQYAGRNVDKVDYALTDTTTYTFDNKVSAWFAQLSYRPTQVSNKVLRRFELAGRYGALDNPKGAKWGVDKTQLAIALDYWIAWNAVIKVSYEQDVNHPDVGSSTNAPTRYLLSMAMGF